MQRLSHGLEDLVTVPGEGVQPGNDVVLDVAGHALDVKRNPVSIILVDG